MIDQTLEHIFESKAKIKTLRLFLMNPEHQFTLAHGAQRAQLSLRALKNEVVKLVKIGLIESRLVRETIELPTSKAQRKRNPHAKAQLKVVKKLVFAVDKNFLLYPELRNLIFKVSPDGYGDLIAKIRRLGDIRLAIVSGVFTNTDDARADLMIVGDKLSRTRVSSFFKQMQSEVGKELHYAVMTTPEFEYRRSMQDRFIRDILDFPHEKLINKLGI